MAMVPPLGRQRYPYWRGEDLEKLLAAIAVHPDFVSPASPEPIVTTPPAPKPIPTTRLAIYSGTEIGSEPAWLLLAPPAGGKSQWREGKSARELAHRWVESVRSFGTVPPEIGALLETHERTQGFVGMHAFAEVETRLDGFKGDAQSRPHRGRLGLGTANIARHRRQGR
jgi:hypothetical protein